MLEMRCPECGFRLDPINESQQVCPACGGDPIRCEEGERGAGIAAVLAYAASLADDLTPLPQSLAEDLAVDLAVDYISDPELDLIVADPEAYINALFGGPILVLGNHLIN